MLEVRSTKFPEVFLVVPDVFPDERGFFKEVFSASKYEKSGMRGPFVQDNFSFSRRGVLRGMHYDLRMAKLVQCVDGAIYDVVVDMREDSPAYKQWDAFELSSENHLQVYIPAGFAHGFYVLSDRALVLYKQTAQYDPAHERAVSWRDPSLGIKWPLEDGEPILSAKDALL